MQGITWSLKMPPENGINKKRFTNGMCSDQNPDLKKLFFHLDAHKIISMMKIHSVKPNKRSIFMWCYHTNTRGNGRPVSYSFSFWAQVQNERAASSNLSQETSIVILFCYGCHHSKRNGNLNSVDLWGWNIHMHCLGSLWRTL